MREVPRPSGTDVLANLLLGPDPGAPELPEDDGLGVHAALEQAMLPALARPPCFVSFSGGRDSSAILAVAVEVARRHGLDDPVPAILRFPGVPETDETSWQELVLSHLRVDAKEVIELGDELDALGLTATEVLRRDGLRWPANGYLHAPILDRARGGSMLTGAGGDELLGTAAARHVLVLRRRAGPRPRDVIALARPAVPRRLRALARRARTAPPTPWLTDAGATDLNRALARDDVAWPHRWDRSVAHWYRSRAFAALDGAFATMAQERDVTVVNPFLNPPVLAALAAAGGPSGFASRGDAMTQLFGGLLPEKVLTRETKAAFTRAFWGPETKAFAAAWSGAGVDEGRVDVAALRREWLSEQPHFQTILLLHNGWLHQGVGGDQPSASSS